MQLPGPVRAAVGLVATAADEAKHLPDRAIELPMLAVSSALQLSLRAQQRYARLAARGDEALSRRRTGDEPPAWATFDDPVAGANGRGPADGGASATADAAQSLGRLLGQGGDDSTAPAPAETATPAEQATPAKRAAADERATPAEESTPAEKSAPAKKAAKRAPAKKAAARKAAAKKTDAGTRADSGSEKTVNKPRHTPPSRFDNVTDQRDDG